MLKLSYINNVANSQQNVVLRIMMSFGNLTLFDTIWKRKFRILTRFFVIFNHIVTWFPTKKSMDVRPSNLWSNVLIPLGRTCIHPNAVRPYSPWTSVQRIIPLDFVIKPPVSWLLRIAYLSRRETSVDFIAFSETMGKAECKENRRHCTIVSVSCPLISAQL